MIASSLIEELGVEAVTMARVSELAGCARTLVYRYYPTREDLLVGVLNEYFSEVDARLTANAHRMAAASDNDSSLSDLSMQRLAGAYWDIMEEGGLGGAILVSIPLLSASVRARVDAAWKKYERRFTDPLESIGLEIEDARAVLDMQISTFVCLALRARSGRIDRETAIRLYSQATLGFLKILKEKGLHHG